MPPIQTLVRDIPLLRPKISIPRSPTEFVHRPRLTERINHGVKGPLTLLAAPAGFGKTNLLIEWAENTPLPVAWLTIDSADNDQGRLLRYIIGALQTLEPSLGKKHSISFNPPRASAAPCVVALRWRVVWKSG